jgi:predicted transcriptional regulator
MSPKPPPALFELEADVMDEVWARGQATVRQVMDALNERSSKSRAYTTVMTTMRRLDRKGLLGRERRGKTDIYSPALTREAYRQLRAQTQVGALVDEYGDVALIHFARQWATLDPDRREQLQRLAEDD